MRAVFVNHCHPETPHVCGTRLREFAHALSARGHQIILLTETLDGAPDAKSPEEVGRDIEQHDFTAPYYLPCAPAGFPLLTSLRKGRLPWGIRQAVIFWHFIRHAGVFTNWVLGSQPHLKVVGETFKPDIIWGSFGCTDCWNIAQQLAKLSNCPWVADIKDLWHVFIPSPFKRRLNRRYWDATALTTFSTLHEIESGPYFPMKKQVVYSGFHDGQIRDSVDQSAAKDINISLTGGIYHRNHLDHLIKTLANWLAGLEQDVRDRVSFIYAGSAHEEVAEASAALQSLCTVKIHQYLAIDDYFNLLKSCRLNMYIRSEGAFHHKVFEFLAIGRPILCYPAESHEVIDIADQVNGPLFSCGTASEIVASLDSILGDRLEPQVDREKLSAYRWDSQAEILEGVLLAEMDKPTTLI